MNDAERDLIAKLFQRIRGAEGAYRDPDAEAFIQAEVARQPHAPYALAQTVVVQDRALDAAKQRIDELERDLADARDAARDDDRGASSPWGPRAQDAVLRPGGFASGGYERGRDDYDGRPGERMSTPFGAPRRPDQAGPGYAYQPQAAPQPQDHSRGGGFLSGALQTAAGVAGGALLFEGVRHMFGGADEAKAAAADPAKLAGDAPEGGGDAGGGDIGSWYSGLFGDAGKSADAGDRTQPVDDGGDVDEGGGSDDWV